ncbi:MAG: CRISPR-associated endoribonuclease Cas6 [Candidatus Heimdallarchaeota archaeon]
MSMHSLKFNVRPAEPVRVPTFLGHRIRGAFLQILSENNPNLTASLHEGTSLREYSVQPLLPEGVRFLPRKRVVFLRPEQRAAFRVNLLVHDLGREALECLLSLAELEFKLGSARLLLESVEVKVIPLQDLLPQENQGPPKSATVEFLSPTQYTSRGSKHPMMLFPDPRYVFGNLVAIWNRVAGDLAVIKRKSLIDWINDDVFVIYYSLYTRKIDLGKQNPFTGFVGKVEFRIHNSDNPESRWLVPLLRLARFSNVGNKRTAGMGVVEVNFH